MNREQKRLMQRQGQVGADGAPATRRTTAEDVQRRRSERATPREFFSQVRQEMRQVSWPTRPEVVNYTSIVFFVLVFMTALIYGLGVACSHFVTFLFTK